MRDVKEQSGIAIAIVGGRAWMDVAADAETEKAVSLQALICKSEHWSRDKRKTAVCM